MFFFYFDCNETNSLILSCCRYYRHLAEEIRCEYSEREDGKVEDLIKLSNEIIPYDMKHNAEIDACDLAMEIERLDLLEKYVDKSTFQRVCLYLSR